LSACTVTDSSTERTLAPVPLVAVPDTLTSQRPLPASEALRSSTSAVTCPDGQKTLEGAAVRAGARRAGAEDETGAADGVTDADGLTVGFGVSRAKKSLIGSCEGNGVGDTSATRVQPDSRTKTTNTARTRRP
jgi:hypothetical protein